MNPPYVRLVVAFFKIDIHNLKRAKKQIKGLEKELLRKDKALAEAAALLVLQKSTMRFGRTRQNDLPDTAQSQPYP